MMRAQCLTICRGRRWFASATAADAVGPPPETRVQASIPAYFRHILVASHTHFSQWPKRLELPSATASQSPRDAASFYTRLTDAIKDKQFTSADPLLRDQTSNVPVSAPPVTVCPRLTVFDVSTMPSATREFAESDLLIFSAQEPPAHLRVASSSNGLARDLRNDQLIDLEQTQNRELKRVLRILQPDGATATISTTAVSTTSDSSAQYELYAFVCCHALRDERCGARGPPLVDAINRYAATLLSHAGVRVRAFPCSHVGQHELAPNVLLYAFRKGDAAAPTASPTLNDWFGLLTPMNVRPMLDAYVKYLTRALGSGEKMAATLNDEQLNEARRWLLRQPLVRDAQAEADAPAASDSAQQCMSCQCGSAVPASDEPLCSSAVTSLAHVWRGAMGVERTAARTLIREALASNSQ